MTQRTMTPVDLLPDDETARIAAVRRYDILDTPPDGAFDRLTAIAARFFDVPIAIVSIVDTDRIWFKSHHGIEVEQIDRDPGLCASAILQDGPWIVENAATDPRTLANPLVAGELGLRFYAAVPLTTADGFNLGTLCVIDQEPRHLEDNQIRMLEDLARVVVDELELRLSARDAIALEAESRRTAEDLSRTLQESLLPPELPAIDGFAFASRYHVALRDLVGGDFYDVIPTDAGCTVVVGDVCGKGAPAAALTGMARWTLRTASLNNWPPARVLARLNEVVGRAHAGRDRYLTVAIATLQRSGDAVEMTVSLGGHPHPSIVRADGSVEAVGTTASIVGWKSGVLFVDARATLHTGDLVVLFTDGLEESIAGYDDDAQARLHQVFAGIAGRAAKEAAETIDRAISDGLRDDAAFVVIEVR